MNEKEFLQSVVYEEMMNQACQCFYAAELRYDVNDDKTYIVKKSKVLFDREDIAKHVLAAKGINPKNFDEVFWKGSLDIFLGPVLEGDNVGEGPVWFTVEQDLDGQILAGYYTIYQDL